MNAILSEDDTTNPNPPIPAAAWLAHAMDSDDPDVNLSRVFTEYMERVSAFADVLGDEDAMRSGSRWALSDTLLGMTEDAKHVLMAWERRGKTEATAPTDDDEVIKALLDRYLERVIDLFPVPLGSALHGAAYCAHSGDVAGLQRHVERLEAEPFGIVGIATQEAPMAPRAVTLGKHAEWVEYANTRDTLTSAARSLLLMHSCATQSEGGEPTPEAAAEALDYAHNLLALAEEFGREGDAARRMEVSA